LKSAYLELKIEHSEILERCVAAIEPLNSWIPEPLSPWTHEPLNQLPTSNKAAQQRLWIQAALRAVQLLAVFKIEVHAHWNTHSWDWTPNEVRCLNSMPERSGLPIVTNCRLSTNDFRLKPQERSDANFRQAAACPYSFQLPTSS
jgi:hypothetical protein